MDSNDREAERKEAMRPVEEAGGGVAEGFEQSEEELIENAGHGEGDPLADSENSAPENIEGQRSGAEYGDADDLDPET